MFAASCDKASHKAGRYLGPGHPRRQLGGRLDLTKRRLAILGREAGGCHSQDKLLTAGALYIPSFRDHGFGETPLHSLLASSFAGRPRGTNK